MKYLILLLAVLLCVSCNDRLVQEEPPIMRIGSSVLRFEDLTDAVGVDATPEQKLNYIRRWSDKELTYQAAIERGLDKDGSVRRTIENMRKEFLSVQYIQQEIGRAGPVEVFADEIQKEFRENPELYLRKEPVVRVAKIVVDSRAAAWRAREGLTPENFRARGEAFSLETIPPFDGIRYTTPKNFSPETWTTLFASRVMSITLPIEENGLFTIYLILGKENVGSPSILEEVIDDIKRTVITKKQNKLIRSIYDGLRNRYDYYYDREFIASLEKSQSIQTSLATEEQE